MKTQTKLLICLVSLGTLAGSLQSAEPPHLYVPSVNADADFVFGTNPDPILQVGSTREEVLAKVGNPAVKITRNDWAYLDVSLESSAKGMEAYDTLVFSFKNGTVIGIYLIKRASLDGLVASARRHPKEFDVKRSLLAKSE